MLSSELKLYYITGKTQWCFPLNFRHSWLKKSTSELYYNIFVGKILVVLTIQNNSEFDILYNNRSVKVIYNPEERGKVSE